MFFFLQNVKAEPSSEDAPSPYTDISMMEEDTNDRVSILQMYPKKSKKKKLFNKGYYKYIKY